MPEVIPQWLQYGAAGILLMLGLDLWRLYRAQLSALQERWARQEAAEDAARDLIVRELAALRLQMSALHDRLPPPGGRS